MIQASNVLHIRFDGQSCDVAMSDLDISIDSTDRVVRRKLAQLFNVSEQRFVDYKIDRHQTGNMTVRPEAIFG